MPDQERVFNKWPPANTPENRRDIGCYRREAKASDDDGCWCGAEIIAGYGQCEQCRNWLT